MIDLSYWFLYWYSPKKLLLFTGTVEFFSDPHLSPHLNVQIFIDFLNDSRFFWLNYGFQNFDISGDGSILIAVYFRFLRLWWVFFTLKSHVHLQYMWFITQLWRNYFYFSKNSAFEIDSENGMSVFWNMRFDFGRVDFFIQDGLHEFSWMDSHL